ANYVTAYMWFSLAATHFPLSDPRRNTAITSRDLVGKLMSREQIAEAQRRAREWAAKSGAEDKPRRVGNITSSGRVATSERTVILPTRGCTVPPRGQIAAQARCEIACSEPAICPPYAAACRAPARCKPFL